MSQLIEEQVLIEGIPHGKVTLSPSTATISKGFPEENYRKMHFFLNEKDFLKSIYAIK